MINDTTMCFSRTALPGNRAEAQVAVTACDLRENTINKCVDEQQQQQQQQKRLSDSPVFQYVSVPGRSYTILVPVPERVSEFHERFGLAIITESVIARLLSQYAFSQDPADERFSKRVRLEIAPTGDSIDAIIQGTVGRNRDGEPVLLGLHRVIAQIPIGSELELFNDIRSGHYPFRSRPIANVCLMQGSPVLLTKGTFDVFWEEIDTLRAWGFACPIDGTSPPEGTFTFAEAFEQPWCGYQSLAKFLTFLVKEHYPYLQDGVITELGFNRLLARKKARRARYKADWQKTDRSNTRRRARQTSLGADSHGKELLQDAVKERISCPQK